MHLLLFEAGRINDVGSVEICDGELVGEWKTSAAQDIQEEGDYDARNDDTFIRHNSASILLLLRGNNGAVGDETDGNCGVNHNGDRTERDGQALGSG